jgi:hypothetical protein
VFPLNNEDGPSRVEQVLAANDGHSVDQQMAQLMATLQQKEDELVALREQMAHEQVANHNHNNDRDASTSHITNNVLNLHSLLRRYKE